MARPESGREPGNFRKAWSFLAPRKYTSKEASANFQSVPEDPLQTGTKYFISASKEYAASVTAQAAAIAQMCQNSGQNPAELRDTLVSNPDRLEQIASAANSLHTRAKVQNPYLTTPEKVKHEKVEEIITKDFSIAEQMMGLSAKDLRKLLGKYKTYKFEDNELGYRLEAYHLLESKGSQNADYILDGSPAEQTVIKRILPTDIDSNPRERHQLAILPEEVEANAPQEGRVEGDVQKERRLSEPEYFSYLETLGEYSGITVINSETGSIHESGVEGAIPLHLDPRAGTDAVVKAIVSIQKRTPRSSGSETTEEDMSGMTEEQLLKKLEKTILVHGIHSLPRTLGKNGWNEEARKALSLKEGDNRSIYEMLAPEIDKLNAARSATTDPDMISNVELQFAVILQDLIAKIPYAIKGGASRKQIESKQEVNCVGSDELALVLEEADIPHAVTRLAKHDLVFALTANGSIYVIDPRNPHPKFRLSNRSMQAVGTDGKPVSVSDIVGYIDTASPEGLRITVDPDFYSQIHPDPRPNETDFWMVIGSPENTLAADVLHHISVNLPPDSHQAKLFAASLMSDLAPQVATSHRVKSRVFFESGQYDIALNEINRAIDLDKGSDSSRAHRGLIYLYGFRDYKAAFDDFSAAAELNPDNAGHWKNLATVYRHLGLYEQEEQCLTMANDIYPNNSDLQRLLAKAHIASVLEKDIHSGLDRIENGHLDQPVQASHDEELTDKVETALHANLEGQQQSDVVVDKGAEYQRQVGTDSGEIPLERRDPVEAIAQGDKSPTGSVPAELEKGHKITSGEDAQERGTELDSDTSSSVRQLQPGEAVRPDAMQPKPDEQAEPSVDGGEKQLEQPDAETIPPVTQPAQAPVPEEEMPERQAPPVTPTDAPESKVNPSDKPEVPQQDKKELEPPPVTTDAPVPREEAEKQPVPPEPTHPAEPEQIVPSPEEHSAPEPEQDLDSQGDAAAKTFNDLETNGNDHGRIELPEPSRQEPPAPDPVPSPSQDSRVPVTEHDIIKQIDNGNNTNGE